MRRPEDRIEDKDKSKYKTAVEEGDIKGTAAHIGRRGHHCHQQEEL